MIPSFHQPLLVAFLLSVNSRKFSNMVENDPASRGRELVQRRLGQSIAPPQSGTWEVTALRSEIETLESILSVKDKELALLRQQLVDSNKFLKTARHTISDFSRPPEEGMLQESDELSSATTTLLESFQHSSLVKRKSILSHIERVLGVRSLEELSRSVDKLVATETKYMELVKAVCVRDRVDINKVSHNEILRTIRLGEALDNTATQNEIKKKAGMACTWTGQFST